MLPSNPITSFAMIHNEQCTPRNMASSHHQELGEGNTIKEVAELLTNLSAIAEKEVVGAAHSQHEFNFKTESRKQRRHLLLDSGQSSIVSRTSITSLESYIESCRLKKVQQNRARAVSIDSTSAAIEPNSPPLKGSFGTQTSPLSAVVTPISSPLVGPKAKALAGMDSDDGELSQDDFLYLNKAEHHTSSSSTLKTVPTSIQFPAQFKSSVQRKLLSAVTFIDSVEQPVANRSARTNRVPNITSEDATFAASLRKSSKMSKKLKIASKKAKKSKAGKYPRIGQKTLIIKRFCWRDFPELENILVSSRNEYLSFSSRNYTPDQKKFNNNLTAKIIKKAADCGYQFDPQHFDFSGVRDRIRCFYKSYVQGEKKRLYALLSTTTNMANIQKIKSQITFLEARSSGSKKK